MINGVKNTTLNGLKNTWVTEVITLVYMEMFHPTYDQYGPTL